MTTETIRVDFATSLDSRGIESGSDAAKSAIEELGKSFERSEGSAQKLLSSFDSFDKVGGSAGGGGKSSGIGGLAATFGKLSLAASATIGAIAGVGVGIKKMLDRAEEGARAVQQFEGALSSIGASTMATESEILALSQAFEILGEESGRGAGDFAQYASQLTAFGVSQEQTVRTLIAALNIANQEGKDLDLVFNALFDTFKGSNTQAVKLGINVAGIAKEELKHGAAIEAIEETYGKIVQESDFVSENQKESAVLSDEIDRQFASIFESTEFIRDGWQEVLNIFKKVYIEALKIVDVGFQKLEDIIFDYKLILNDLFKFLRINAQFDLSNAAGGSLAFGEDGSQDDGSGSDANATPDESGANARNKALQDLLAALNRTNRQTNFRIGRAARSVKDAIKEDKPLTIGNILGDAKAALGAEAQFVRLSNLIGTTLQNDTLGPQLQALFGDGIAITPASVTKLAESDERIRGELANIFSEQLIANQFHQADLIQSRKDSEERRQERKERREAEQDRQDSITVSSITSEASGLNTAAELSKSFEDNLRRLNIDLSAQEAENLAKINEPFRQTLLTGFARLEREDEAARKAREAAEKEAQALAEAQLELDRQAQETRMKILGGINAGIGIVSSGASATTSDADIANIEDDAQRDEASLANLDVGIAAAKDITQQVSDAFGPVIGTIANAFLNIFTLDAGQIETFFQNLASGFTIIIEKISQNLSPIIKAIVKAIPVISKALINAIPAVIQAIIDLIPFLIQHIVELIPDMLQTIANVLRVLIQNAFALWANTWLSILSSIPLIGEAFQGLSIPYAQLEGGSRDNLASYNQLTDRVEAARASSGDDDEGSGRGGGSSGRRSREEAQRGITIGGVTRTDNVLTAAEAFNPYFDSGRQRQRQPIQLQIQIGNQRLRDILTDLDESGYNRVVTA